LKHNHPNRKLLHGCGRYPPRYPFGNNKCPQIHTLQLAVRMDNGELEALMQIHHKQVTRRHNLPKLGMAYTLSFDTKRCQKLEEISVNGDIDKYENNKNFH
jgi:hypothetical protein